MVTVTKYRYENVLDENGNQTFDENGIAITRIAEIEEVEEPAWQDPTINEILI